MKISLSSSGDTKKLDKFLKKMKQETYLKILDRYAQEGVKLLSNATPKDSGKTASSWSYEVENNKGEYTIYWRNDNVNKGVNIALILQTGHGTRNGGYVVGRDYINPAMRPAFDMITKAAWEEIVNS